MEKQLLGTEAPLKKGPGTMNYDGDTGKPVMELLGTQAPISRTPSGIQAFNHDIKGGTMELLGSEAPLSTTGIHGWESWDTPMSKRAIAQSEGPGAGSQKGKRS